tara:strand:+ start:1698 stop:1895 length:198 start_codon:yes stop_codon:yes gene_type:complete
MKIILKKSCDEIAELLEVYSSLQERLRTHVNKISECIKCDKKSNIYLDGNNVVNVDMVDNSDCTE